MLFLAAELHIRKYDGAHTPYHFVISFSNLDISDENIDSINKVLDKLISEIQSCFR